VIRYCTDIGMFALDRPRDVTCVHATEYCWNSCFNNKLERAFPAIHPRDIRNENYYQRLDGPSFKAVMKRKRKSTRRFRGCTRGENFSNRADVLRWYDIITANPDTDFWLPCRAWRDKALRALILELLMPLPNAHVAASLDPETIDQWPELQAEGWLAMYFGDDNDTPRADGYACPKTWHHKHFKAVSKAPCTTCTGGCFSKKPILVHLKQH